MTDQLSLFAPARAGYGSDRGRGQRRPVAPEDLPEERAKEQGKKLAASARHTDLRLARGIALELAKSGLPVSGDDVRRVLAERHPEALEGNLNYLGAVWERSKWVAVGRIKSKTAGSHSNDLRTWVLRRVGE